MYIERSNEQKRVECVTRYQSEFNNDRAVVDSDMAIKNPNWDIYKNNHFALRKRCLNVLLKFVNRMVIRHRAGKRLAKLKERLKDESVRNTDDAQRMIAEDWKTAQNVFLDDETDVDFKFNIKDFNIHNQKLPVEYEANITSFKETVEAFPPTSFDDMVPFKPLECLEYEMNQYKPMEMPCVSYYIPIEDKKPHRPGCEHECAIKGASGDPDTYLQEPEERVIGMPDIFQTPLDFPANELIMPHPTIRNYERFKRFSEVDPEYFLAPVPRNRL